MGYIRVSRVTDLAYGKCYNHRRPRDTIGVIVSGDNTVVSEGKATAAMGDIVVFDCGHIGIIADGSNICDVRGREMARIGSLVAGQVIGVVITGADNIDSL